MTGRDRMQGKCVACFGGGFQMSTIQLISAVTVTVTVTGEQHWGKNYETKIITSLEKAFHQHKPP